MRSPSTRHITKHPTTLALYWNDPRAKRHTRKSPTLVQTGPVNFKSSRLQNSVSPEGGASQFPALPERLKLERVLTQEAAGQQSEFLFTSSFFASSCLHTCWGLAAKKTKIDQSRPILSPAVPALDRCSLLTRGQPRSRAIH